MRTRIISTLLLLAMLVTAVPLAAFSVLAVDLAPAPEGIVYEPEDYNALYEKDGLFHAADFFLSNEYWYGPEAYAPPKTPLDSSEVLYIYTVVIKKESAVGSKTYTYSYYNPELASPWVGQSTYAVSYATKAEAATAAEAALADIHAKIAENNAKEGATQIDASLYTCYAESAVTPAYTAALKQWQSDTEAWSKKLSWYTYDEKNLYITNWWPTPAIGKENDSYVNHSKNTLTLATKGGYATLLPNTFHTHGGMQMAGLKLEGVYTDELSMQIIGSIGTVGSPLVIFYDIRPTTAAAGNGKYVSGIGAGFTVDQTNENNVINRENVIVADAGAVVDMTYSISNSATAKEDVFTIRRSDDTLFRVSGDWAKAKTPSFYYGWSGTAQNSRVYAIRNYSKPLSEASIRKNHLADLLKYYRLDLGYVLLLDETELAALAEEVKDVAISDGYEAVSGAVLGAARRAAEAKYSRYDTDFLSLAATYGLDLSPLDIYPYHLLPATYTFLTGGYRDCADAAAVQADYNAAVEADVTAYIARGEGAYDDYNAHYVTNGLQYWMDAFRFNSIWGEKITMPTPPYELTNYEYNGETYDFTKLSDRVLSGREQGYVVWRQKTVAALAEGETQVKTRLYLADGETPSFGALSAATHYAGTDKATAEARAQALNEAETEGYEYGITSYNPSRKFIILEKSNITIDMHWQGGTSVAPKADANDTLDGIVYPNRNQWSWNSGTLQEYDTEDDALRVAADMEAADTNDAWTFYVLPNLGTGTNSGATAAYAAAVQAYKTDLVNNVQKKMYVASKPSSIGLNIPNIGYLGHHDPLGLYQKAPYIVGDGYLGIYRHHSNAYLTLTAPSTETVTGEFVFAPGDVNYANAQHMTLRDITLKGSYDGEALSFSGFYNYNLGTNPADFADFSIPAGPADPISFVMVDHRVANSDNTSKHTVTVYANGEEKLKDFSVEDTKAGANNLLYYANQGSPRMYAYRVYSRALGVDEQAQNHFADIAKFFRLNLSGFAAVADKAALYEAFADVTFTNMSRIEAQMLLSRYLLGHDAAENEYNAIYDGYLAKGVDPAYVEIGRLYGLDLEVLTFRLPSGLITRTQRVLDSLLAAKDTAPDFAGAAGRLRDAVAEDLATDITAVEDIGDYNRLYVTDRLIHAIDFYATNAYWGTTASQKLVDHTWHSSTVVAGVSVPKFTTSTAPIGNGYAHDFKDFVLEFTRAAGNKNIDGSTMELVALPTTMGSPALVMNDIRFSMATDAATGKVSLTQIAQRNDNGVLMDSDKSLLVRNLSKGEAPIATFTLPTLPATYTVTATVPKMTQSYYEYSGSATSFTVTHQRVDGAVVPRASTYTQMFAFYIPEYAEYEGQQVIVGAIDRRMVVDGTPGKGLGEADSALGGAKGDYYQTESGKVALILDGRVIYDNDEVYYMNNERATGDDYINLWSAAPMKYYASRHYAKELTADELLQNHFADVAKFYRLDITVLANLDADGMQTIYEAMAGVAVDGGTRTEVQMVYQQAVSAELEKAYARMAEGHPEVVARNADFFRVAAAYRLILTSALESTRTMDYAVDFVVEENFSGCTLALAAERFAEACHDAYYYYSYETDNAAWGGFLAKAAALNLDTEALMALPRASREGIAAVVENPTQAEVDSYVATERARYDGVSEKLYTAAEYDALYVQDGLVFAMDFFKTNRYWNPTGEALVKFPVGPAEIFWEDENGNGLIELAELTDEAYTDAGRTAHSAAWNTALSTWSKDDANFLKAFITTKDTKMSVSSYKVTKLAQANLAYSVYRLGEGYIEMRNDISSDGGLVFGGTGNYKSENVSQQYIGVPGKKTYDTFSLFYNARPVAENDGASLHFTGMKSHLNGKSDFKYSESTPIPLDGTALDLTLTLEGMTTTPSATRFIARTANGTYAVGSGSYGTWADKDGNSANGKEFWDETVNATQYLGYGGRTDMRLYAYRQYNKELTQEEIIENHFADIAKYFRLDIDSYRNAGEETRAALLTVMKDYDLATSTREEVVAAYYDVIFADVYRELGDRFSEGFMELARRLSLDLRPMADLTAEQILYVEGVVAGSFTVGYAMDHTIVQSIVNDLAGFFASMRSDGMSVRIHTGYEAADMPGVRALFSVDPEALGAFRDREITFGVKILNEKGAVRATLTFTPTFTEEGVSITGESKTATGKTAPAIVREDENGRLTFAYTVIYSSAAVQTAEYYTATMSYRSFITVDGVCYDYDLVHSIFEDTVSAAEVYTYFYENAGEHGLVDEEGKIDSVVTAVYETLNPKAE